MFEVALEVVAMGLDFDELFGLHYKYNHHLRIWRIFSIIWVDFSRANLIFYVIYTVLSAFLSLRGENCVTVGDSGGVGEKEDHGITYIEFAKKDGF